MKKGIMRMSSRLKARLPRRKKVGATENKAPSNNRDNISVEHDSDKPRGRGIAGRLLGMIVWPFAICGRIAMLPLVLARKVTVGIFSKKAKKLASRVAETGESSVAIDRNEQTKSQQSNAEDKSLLQKLTDEVNDIARNNFVIRLYYWDPLKKPRRLGRVIIFSLLGLGPIYIIYPLLIVLMGNIVVYVCDFVALQDSQFCEIACNFHNKIKCEKHEQF